MPNNFTNYFYPIMDSYMAQQEVDRLRKLRLWTWDDTNKIVNFMKYHRYRCAKYGLNIPYDKWAGMTKQDLKDAEDKLTSYFLHEMRKAPVTAA